MMKKLYFGAVALLQFLLLGGCAEVDKSCVDPAEEIVEISRADLAMADMTSDIQVGTRAVNGFVVNTADDPTYSIGDKQGWSLDLALYKKNGTPYTNGSGTFTWDGSYWTSSATIYMPHYLMQDVEAELYPASWTGTIALDQSDETDFLEQDILVQFTAPTYETAPAHYLKVKMRHAHSMIDFVLADVNPADIASVTVEADGDTYKPYKALVTGREEYLVILPVDITNPAIKVTTNAGATYSKELVIPLTEINTCYYVRLVGLELILEAITVSNWTYGEAVAGDYSTVTSYPTFRGRPNTSLTIYYNNDRYQTVAFNDRGEATVKPVGRTIIKIGNGSGEYVFDDPVSIRGMIIDLNDYIDLIS